jgi:hypothetical protein
MPSESFVSDTVPIPELMALVDDLRAIRDAAGPADRETLQKACDWLSLQGGMIRGLESRLNGDFAAIPDTALYALVMQHGFIDGPELAAAMALAVDVRLLCFFRTLQPAP